jgi:hypothetical protein
MNFRLHGALYQVRDLTLGFGLLKENRPSSARGRGPALRLG